MTIEEFTTELDRLGVPYERDIERKGDKEWTGIIVKAPLNTLPRELMVEFLSSFSKDYKAGIGGTNADRA